MAALIGSSTKSPWRSATTSASRREEFQLWKLIVDQEDDSAELTCDDGNGRILYREDIAFTDFPLPEVTLYFTDNTILLPSEY